MNNGFCVLLVLFAVSAAQPVRIVPQDEGAGDASFVAFRAELRAAAEACDQAVLWKLFADDVEDPAGGKGLDAMRRDFEVEQRDQKAVRLPVCDELATALGRGALKETRGYCAPYALCIFDDPRYRSAGTGVATGPKVVMRSGPQSGAPVVDTLSYDVVRVCAFSDTRACDEVVSFLTPGWTAVVSPRGKLGYVQRDQILIPIDNYPYYFGRRGATWRVVSVFIWE